MYEGLFACVRKNERQRKKEKGKEREEKERHHWEAHWGNTYIHDNKCPGNKTSFLIKISWWVCCPKAYRIQVSTS